MQGLVQVKVSERWIIKIKSGDDYLFVWAFDSNMQGWVQVEVSERWVIESNQEMIICSYGLLISSTPPHLSSFPFCAFLYGSK